MNTNRMTTCQPTSPEPNAGSLKEQEQATVTINPRQPLEFFAAMNNSYNTNGYNKNNATDKRQQHGSDGRPQLWRNGGPERYFVAV